MSDRAEPQNRFWNSRPATAALVVLVLGATVALPGSGILAAFLLVVVAALLGRKQGSVHDLGLRAPSSWPRLLATTAAYGTGLQLLFAAVIEPLLTRWTGTPIDMSAFEAIRGNPGVYLLVLALGWAVGGFLEELTLRGFVVGRLRWLLGSGPAATGFAVLLSATAFGIAHTYQGVTGVLSTGLAGLAFGAVFVRHGFNLWYPVFTHGFMNTLGITAVYLNADRALQGVGPL
ncbi:MAG TPA: type II CAAX endopeptidase family protein [Woeseiaceae bacterium]|nr:type II CAAX endopeptidase family protein [Woeseiaceae bacterium]